MNAVMLIFQICLAPASGGLMLQGCVHRTVEAADCRTALAMTEATLARTHVAVMDRDGHGVVVVLTAVPVNKTTARHGDGRLRPAAPRRSCRCTSGGRHRRRDALSSALVASRETR